MAMVGVDSSSLYRRTHSLSRLAWSWVGGRLVPFYIHQMNRVNSTINIVLDTIIIIIDQLYSPKVLLLLLLLLLRFREFAVKTTTKLDRLHPHCHQHEDSPRP